jgi:hypothetical protein
MPSDDQTPVQKVQQAFRLCEDYMTSWHRKCDDFYALYRAAPNQQLYNIVTRSNYVVPLIYKTVETILPRIFSIIFSASPPIQSRYRIKTDQSEFQLRALDQLFEFLFDHNENQAKIQAWIKDSLIYGQSYLKVGWKLKRRQGTRTVAKFNPETGDVEDTREPFNEVVEDRVDLQQVDVRDLFFSPEASFPDPFATAKYVVHRIRKRKSELIRLRDSGVYDDFDESGLSPTMAENESLERKQSAIYRPSEPKPDSEDPMIDIYEYWEDERVITTANHQVLLRDQPNPFRAEGKAPKKPFIACFDTLVPNELFQIGEAEPLMHTQIEMSARPGMLVGARPIDGSLGNSVMPLPRRDVSNVSYKEFQDLTQDAQDTSGLLDYAIGASPERRETATTVQLLQTAANLRFDIKIRNYSSSFLALGYMVFERWKQFLTRPVKIRVPMEGEQIQYVEIDRNTLPQIDEVDLVAPGNPGLLLKDARAQRILQMYQGLMQNPMANPAAALQLFILALKESELDGIEPIIALLQQPSPQPVQPGGNGGVAAPQPPTAPPLMSQMNENPNMIQGARPER